MCYEIQRVEREARTKVKTEVYRKSNAVVGNDDRFLGTLNFLQAR